MNNCKYRCHTCTFSGLPCEARYELQEATVSILLSGPFPSPTSSASFHSLWGEDKEVNSPAGGRWCPAAWSVSVTTSFFPSRSSPSGWSTGPCEAGVRGRRRNKKNGITSLSTFLLSRKRVDWVTKRARQSRSFSFILHAAWRNDPQALASVP